MDANSTIAKILKGAGSIAIALVAFSVARVVVGEGINAFQRQTLSVEKLESVVSKNPNMAGMFATFKQRFPADYNRLMSTVVESAKNDASKEDLGILAHSMMRQFISGKASAISAAPDNSLFRLAQANERLAKTLSNENTQACADFGLVGLKPNTKLSDDGQNAVAAGSEAMILAASDGLQSPTKRNISPLPESDSIAFVNGMRDYGLSTDLLALLGNEAALAKATPQDQCAITVAIYHSVAHLPKPQMARLTSMLVREALTGK